MRGALQGISLTAALGVHLTQCSSRRKKLLTPQKLEGSGEASESQYRKRTGRKETVHPILGGEHQRYRIRGQ